MLSGTGDRRARDSFAEGRRRPGEVRHVPRRNRAKYDAARHLHARPRQSAGEGSSPLRVSSSCSDSPLEPLPPQARFISSLARRSVVHARRRAVRCGAMLSEVRPGTVRLAELVAALSLGIDLGFGQPMEHVLRQCMIALRLAECVGLDDEERSVVYYTALLVNVGCHSDAHEQAKWFGDDIALKSTKYDHEPGLRAAAAGRRRLGAGSPPLHRFRVGLEFALSGHREVDDMIAHHAAIARILGEQLGLPGEVLEALCGAYEQWDGRGWPGQLKGE